MKDRLALLAYLAAVVAATLVHDPRWLGAGLAVALLAAGRDAPRLLRRTILAMLAFSAVVSVGYVVGGWLAGNLSPEYLIRINIRVCLLTFLTSLMVSRVDFLRALNFSRLASYLATLILSQTVTFRRLFEELRQAADSRRLRRLPLRAGYAQSAAAAVHLFDKAERTTAEIALAMRSRGFFAPPAEGRDAGGR
jgi:energy-coupling factor transporter transmembrane protein EcfT